VWLRVPYISPAERESPFGLTGNCVACLRILRTGPEHFRPSLAERDAMFDQPGADSKVVFQELQLPADLVGRRGSGTNFLFDRPKTLCRFFETG